MVAQIDRSYARRRPSRVWARLISYALFEGRPLTTRGQWINPLVFGIGKMVRLLPALKNVEAPIFILGTGRSGTTILGKVLSMHHEVGFLNEPKAIWAQLHPNEDLIGNYNRNWARYRLVAEDASPRMMRQIRRLYGAYLRLSFTRRIVDKYPELIFRTEFVRELFSDSKFIFLSRCGSRTCTSIKLWSERHGERVGSEVHDWWGANDRKWNLLVEQVVKEHPDLAAHTEVMSELDHEGRAAVEWIVAMREGMRLAALDPKGTLHVPYEELCAEPRAWAKRIEKFLGLRTDLIFEDYAESTLVDPGGDSSLGLPNWLTPIFEATEMSLAIRVAEARREDAILK
ncbi:sulfotransferase [Sulfitobacter sp. JBTF-M27]|uniref:Sulfotransferase n=1 Tax=Sulfitobacter sediminilitoris TaxID=2698830 RepID=A0A6P0CJ62_9RHOB|nr:sulfotransferase [Sulfitobacter sediminilitoris]NEK25086.1 sulfotransferase [Sulfitobacter sediminilitoris]